MDPTIAEKTLSLHLWWGDSAGVPAGGRVGGVVKPDARVDSSTKQKIYTHDLELYLVACNPQLHVRHAVWTRDYGRHNQDEGRFRS